MNADTKIHKQIFKNNSSDYTNKIQHDQVGLITVMKSLFNT